jgi:hypothetical protein
VIAVLVLLSLLFVWTLVSDRPARWSITAPLTFALVGVVPSGGDDPLAPLEVDTHAFQRATS